MAGKHHGGLRVAAGEIFHQGFDLALGVGVQAGGGFVKQQQRGLQRNSLRHGHALLLPDRQGARRAVGHVRQAHALQSLQGLRPCGSPGRTAQPQSQGHVACHRQAQHVRALEQHGLRHVGLGLHTALYRQQQPVDQAQQRAFARAVGADQRNALARRDAH